MHIPFNSLKTQLGPYKDALGEAFERVLERGWFLMGPEVEAFEQEFAAWLGLKACAALNSGTDALVLALRALGCEPGGEVILPAHTALPCYHAVLAAGLVPVFAEVEEATYTLDPASVARMMGEKTCAVVAVHLYGQAADLDPLQKFCAEREVPLIEDCAQSHGARYKGRLTGTTGALAAFSFYPTKNLGALGDGGAVCGGRGELDRAVRLLRQYGEDSRYHSVRPGLNSRMDELQAAFLRERLRRLDKETRARRALAARYDEQLAGTPVLTPAVGEGRDHVYHLYVVRAPERDALMAALKERRIGTAIHYPVPGHKQPLFAGEGAAPMRADTLRLTERLAGEILSLPLYPGMPEHHVDAVCDAVREFYGT